MPSGKANISEICSWIVKDEEKILIQEVNGEIKLLKTRKAQRKGSFEKFDLKQRFKKATTYQLNIIIL